MQWWKVEGAVKFPHVSLVAMLILGKPVSNAFQERVFSRGTFEDNILRKRRLENSFEMSILEGLNAAKITMIEEAFNLHSIDPWKYVEKDTGSITGETKDKQEQHENDSKQGTVNKKEQKAGNDIRKFFSVNWSQRKPVVTNAILVANTQEIEDDDEISVPAPDEAENYISGWDEDELEGLGVGIEDVALVGKAIATEYEVGNTVGDVYGGVDIDYTLMEEVDNRDSESE